VRIPVYLYNVQEFGKRVPEKITADSGAYPRYVTHHGTRLNGPYQSP